MARVAALGGHGASAQNCERDTHVLLRAAGITLDAPISKIKVRMYNHKKGRELPEDMFVIWPDDLAACIWRRGEDVFREFFCGTEDISAYWDHHARFCDWFKKHPMANHQPRSHLLPFSLYGDGINVFKQTQSGTVEVLGWTSDFVPTNHPMKRYLLINVYSEHHATESTFEDLMQALVPRLCRMVDPNAVFPWTASGYQWMFSSVQGDLAWICSKFQLFQYRSNEFCSLCPCVKNHPDVSMTLADFRESAAHRQTRYAHEDFISMTEEESRNLSTQSGQSCVLFGGDPALLAPKVFFALKPRVYKGVRKTGWGLDKQGPLCLVPLAAT